MSIINGNFFLPQLYPLEFFLSLSLFFCGKFTTLHFVWTWYSAPIQTLIQTLGVLLTPWKLECDWIGREREPPSLPRSGEVSYRNVFRLHFLSAAGWKSFFEGEASLFGTYRGNFGYLKVGRLLVNRIPVFKANDEWARYGEATGR